MATVSLTLDEIHELACRSLLAAGADDANAVAVSNTVMKAERDGSVSHGLFRIPGYVAGLKSGRVNGAANPKPDVSGGTIVRCNGLGGYAPLALERCIAPLAEAAKRHGVAVLALTRSHHFAALWPETEALAERGVAGIACVCYMSSVAPSGAVKPLFGTNPLSFAWPRPGKLPLVFDMATSAMAKGEVAVAARDGHELPQGTGLDADGNPTTDPARILEGVLLPFGGYKGSAISMMIELLSGGLVGEDFSFEASEKETLKDGAPPAGGEFVLALSPEVIAGPGWNEHAERFISRMSGMSGVRMPGARRHRNRQNQEPREVSSELVEKIKNEVS